MKIIFPEQTGCEHCTDLPPFFPKVEGSIFCLNCDANGGEYTDEDGEDHDLPDVAVEEAFRVYRQVFKTSLDKVMDLLRETARELNA